MLTGGFSSGRTGGAGKQDNCRRETYRRQEAGISIGGKMASDRSRKLSFLRGRKVATGTG